MKHERINIWQENEYQYACAYGFQPNLRTYLHEDNTVRPCILVIPGGGYRMVSPTEGEIVAMCFHNMGFQTFVGTYSTNILGGDPLKLQPLHDISRMLRLIRTRAQEFRLDPNRIMICGFSAGAHLCGSLCVHWQDITDDVYPCSNRPDGAILSYPVITSGEYAHRDSFTALLGPEATQEELDYMSLEKQVNDQTPPIFLWQTMTDELVPVENSYLMAMALKKAGVPVAHHVFPRGMHGLSLSNADWAAGRFGDPYTYEQMALSEKAVKEHRAVTTSNQLAVMHYLLHQDSPAPWPQVPNPAIPEVAVWPVLVDQWIREIV